MAKVAIVTGAARGIGAAIADRLAADGFTVARLDRIEGAGVFRFDLGDLSTHMPALDAVVAKHGRIDCLINNAGIASPKRGEFLDLDPATFDATLDVNLRGTVFFTQAVVKAMLSIDSSAGQSRTLGAAPHPLPGLLPASGGEKETTASVAHLPSPRHLRGEGGPKGRMRGSAEGRDYTLNSSAERRTIQFITSASAALASPDRLDYCISKAGLAMFAKGLALRLAGENIDVFDIRPGIVRTDMTAGVAARYDELIGKGLVPEGRWGTPEDIAAICAALASGALPFSTGSVIDAGGGLHIPKL